jgi:hypothetical protein
MMGSVGIIRKFFAASLGLGGVLLSLSTLAEEKSCECKFSKSPWEAYGTKAACTAYTRKSGTSCEIAFAGLGADPNLIAKVLGQDPSQYFDRVYNLLQESYLPALRANDTKRLTDPELLQSALPIFMRGAFLRDSSGSVDEAAALNKLIEGFVDKSKGDIGKTFRGDANPFEQKIGDATFTVGKGWIVVEYHDTILITVYMPGG